MSIELVQKKINPEKDFKMSEEQTLAMEQALENSLSLQEKLGLGSSKNAGNRLLAGCRAAKSIKALLRMGYSFIEEPDEEKFPRFTGSDLATCHKHFSTPPKFPMVRLVKGVTGVKASDGSRQEWKADLPLVPSTVSTLAERLLKEAPNAEFHLIFEGEWKKLPQKDPVLVARISDGYWCEVGHWGSDADAIRLMLEEKTVQE